MPVSDWNTTIIEQFRAQGGKGVAQFGDALLLLHHTGARTGTVRVNPPAYYEDGDRLVVVASKAGAPENPHWFFNLRANPTRRSRSARRRSRLARPKSSRRLRADLGAAEFPQTPLRTAVSDTTTSPRRFHKSAARRMN